jgi:hypothetical protein
MKELKRQLKMIKTKKGLVNPDSLWVMENKTKILNQISNTNIRQEKKIESFSNNLGLLLKIEKNIETFLPRKLKYNFKPVLAVFLALFMTSGGWIASAYAEPGDMFWGTKVALNSIVERSQIAFASEDNQTELHLKFASKKADVIKTVSEKAEVKPEEKNKIIIDTKEKLKKDLAGANESIKNVSSEKASQLVKEVSQTTTEITNSIKESAEKVAVLDVELAKDMDEAVIETRKTSLEMVEVVLQKKSESNSEITEEEKNIILAHINNIVINLEVDMESFEEKKDLNIDESVSSTINSVSTTEDISTATTAISSVITSTDVLSSTTSSEDLNKNILSEEKTLEIKNILTNTKLELEKNKSEVAILINENIFEAIQKTKEISIIASDAQKKVNDIINNVVIEEKIEAENILEIESGLENSPTNTIENITEEKTETTENTEVIEITEN